MDNKIKQTFYIINKIFSVITREHWNHINSGEITVEEDIQMCV